MFGRIHSEIAFDAGRFYGRMFAIIELVLIQVRGALWVGGWVGAFLHAPRQQTEEPDKHDSDFRAQPVPVISATLISQLSSVEPRSSKIQKWTGPTGPPPGPSV